MSDYFEFPLRDGEQVRFLQCEVEYDYCTEEGQSVYLTKCNLDGWNIRGLLHDDMIIEIEDYSIDFMMDKKKYQKEHMILKQQQYALEQQLTNQSLKRDGELL